MSALDVVRAAAAEVEAGNFAGIAKLIAPDGAFHGTIGGIDEGQVFHGPDAFLAYFGDVTDTWETWKLTVADLRANGDTVVVFWDETTRSRHSAIEMHAETATVFRVRDGLIVEARGFLDRADALKHAGL